MELKATRPASGYEEIDRWAGGFGWLPHPEEAMQRASHALAVERPDDPDAPDDVWVVDPLRAPGIEDAIRDLGNVVGVVVLLDRHGRDAATFARRFDVPLYLPAWIDIDVPRDVEVVRFEDHLPGSEYELIETVDLPGWHEAALYDDETLVVADVLGTADYFVTGAERLGVHPMLRLVPPRALRGLSPTRVVTGHGRGVRTDATRALRDALEGARRRMPRLYFETLRDALPVGRRTDS
jgi:hypothetical protein